MAQPQLWPSTLQQCLNQGGWQYSAENTNIQTSVETGPKKIRRRTTRPEHLMQSDIWFDSSLYQTLNDFYNLTLQNGTQNFFFNNPISGASSVWRFENPIQYSPLGGEQFVAKMVWREQPIA